MTELKEEESVLEADTNQEGIYGEDEVIETARAEEEVSQQGMGEQGHENMIARQEEQMDQLEEEESNEELVEEQSDVIGIAREKEQADRQGHTGNIRGTK